MMDKVGEFVPATGHKRPHSNNVLVIWGFCNRNVDMTRFYNNLHQNADCNSQCRLNAWARLAVARAQLLSMYVVYGMFFNARFCWKYLPMQ